MFFFANSRKVTHLLEALEGHIPQDPSHLNLKRAFGIRLLLAARERLGHVEQSHVQLLTNTTIQLQHHAGVCRTV